MGLFDTQDAPTPPNPITTAAAQTGTNVSTAIANSYLGNVNQNTPQGSLRYDVTGNYGYTDPTTGQSYNIPTWTATQSLSPQGVATQAQLDAAKYNMAGLANTQSGNLGQLLSTPFDPNRGNFDAGAYLRQNPDVYNAAVNSGQNIYDFANQHYQTFGYNEGRMAGGTAAPAMGSMSQFSGVQNPLSSFDQTAGFQFGYGSGGDILSGFNPNSAGQIQTGYNQGGPITRTYGPQDSFSADRTRVENAMFQRLDPQLKQDEARLRQQLSDQGIAYGSKAYEDAMLNLTNRVTDTRLGITQAGLQEQTGLMNMAAQQAGFQNAAQQQAYNQSQQAAAFANAAQQQGYTQQQGLANFWNQAQAQREGQAAARGAFYNQAALSQFDQAAARAQFYNQAQQQALGQASTMFNAQNQLRNQALQEQYQQRNQPINEISALLSGSQVQAPNFINAQRTTIPTTDVAGLINQNFAQQNDLYKTSQGFWGDIIGGVLGAGGRIGGAAMTPVASDVRMKENITPMGSVLTTKGELPIYGYDYKNDDPDEKRHVGPMAQDVERLEPRAVKSIGGRKHILPDKMGSIFGDDGGRRG